MRRAAAAKVDLERVRTPAALVLDRDEIHCRTADHPLPREPPSDLEALGRDPLGVLLVGGEVAPEVRVPVRASEHLVVGRHDVDLPGRAHPQLNARAAEGRALDPLLDDAALVVECCEVVLDALLGVLELERGAKVVGRPVEVEQRVPEAAHSLVELDDRSAGLRTPLTQLLEGPLEISLAVDLEADGVRHVLLLEHAPAAALRPQPEQVGVAAVGRQAEPDRQLDLVRRHREGVNASSGFPIMLRIRRTAPGRARSLRASGSLRPSTSETVENRLRASGVSRSGTSPK